MKSPKQKSNNLPGRISYTDAQTAKHLCGLTHAEFIYYFGWTPGTVLDLSAKADDALLPPVHAMIVRQLLRDPNLCVMPPTPTFESVLDRINQGVDVESYSLEFGSRRKKKLSPRRLVLLMGLTLSAESRLGKGVAPSPIVARMLQHLSRLMDVHGDAEGFERFVKVVREEAASRNMTMAQLFEHSRWRTREEFELAKASSKPAAEQGEPS